MMRKSLIALTAAGALAATAAPASAFHCVNLDKKAGAGTFGFEEIKAAGSSGNVVLPGAFIDDGDGDVFRRGPQHRFDGVVGTGMLPSRPMENGTTEHGINWMP